MTKFNRMCVLHGLLQYSNSYCYADNKCCVVESLGTQVRINLIDLKQDFETPS